MGQVKIKDLYLGPPYVGQGTHKGTLYFDAICCGQN